MNKPPPRQPPMPILYPLAQIGSRWIVGTELGQIATVPVQALASPLTRQGHVTRIDKVPPTPVARYVDPRNGLIHQVELRQLVIDNRWELAAAFDPATRIWVVAGKARRVNGG